MKALDFLHATVGSVSSRVDKSVRFSVETAELSSEEAAILISYHGINARVLVCPIDGAADDLQTVKTEKDTKTPSERLRAVIYLLFKQQDAKGDFDVFYRQQMERLIEHYKAKLNPI